MPCTKRDRMSCITFADNPHKSELSENTKKPSPKTFSLPQRSDTRPKTIDSPILEIWYANSDQEMPMRSVPKLLATVGIEMLTILVAVPEQKVPNRAVERSK